MQRRIILAASGIFLAVPFRVAPAQTPAQVFYACYVPASGNVYRIREPNTPAKCNGAKHVEFSWTDGAGSLNAGATAGGDLTGTYPNPTVARLLGLPLATGTPAAGQVLTFDGNAWSAAAPSASVTAHSQLSGLQADDHTQYVPANGARALTGNLNAGNNRITGLAAGSSASDAVRFDQAIKNGDAGGGDVGGTFPTLTVQRLQGHTISAPNPAANQVLTFNGNAWIAQTPAPVAGSSDHGTLQGLTDDDHTQYLIRDGVRLAQHGFAVTGFLDNGNMPALPSGSTALMWYSAKAAFRAGLATNTAWSAANIGRFSFAAGLNSAAAGQYGVSLGNANSASGTAAAAIGESNTASGSHSFTAGTLNQATGNFSTAIGASTKALADYAVALGQTTTASATAATALGRQTSASGVNATAAGYLATASGAQSFAAGESVSAEHTAAAAFGWSSKASGRWSLATGRQTLASNDNSSAFGWSTVSSGIASAAFGKSTQATADNSFASGNGSKATAAEAAAFGFSTTASGVQAFATGALTEAAGAYAFSAGYNNHATGIASVALGKNAGAVTDGSFVFGDAIGTALVGPTAANQFVVRASGGTRFYSNGALTAGVDLPAGSGAWSSVSDVNRKENFRVIDGDAVLDKIAAMPVMEWNYRSQDRAIRHVGPTAQDFRAAFGLGENDVTISTIDADGINMLAAKALTLRSREHADALAALQAENQELKERVERLEKLLLEGRN